VKAFKSIKCKKSEKIAFINQSRMKLWTRYRTIVSALPMLAVACASDTDSTASRVAKYSIIGVSGTLQDGFPLRDRLDYKTKDVSIPAIFIGKGLVRGYKAYLDIKDPGWREYIAAGDDDDNNKIDSIPPHIPNAVVLPTGCREDANVYWIYAVDNRQVLYILNGEPRFLSITPDTGLIDLLADETDERVRILAYQEIEKQGVHFNKSHIAIPLVTGVWFHKSYIESPPVFIKSDGTKVTSYDGSLAIWAGVRRDALIASDDSTRQNEGVCETEIAEAHRHAWKQVHKAIREAEMKQQDSKTHSPYGKTCDEAVRFGVAPDQVRINYVLSWENLQESVMTMESR